MEDKELVTSLLFATVKECRVFSNLVGMAYVREGDGEEIVILSFQYGNNIDRKSVNVTADSCAALIQDVWSALYRYV